MPTKPPTRRLLIIKLGAIGDVIMAIPAARLLHDRGYEIHWLCGRAVAPILELYPWIHTLPTDESALLTGSKLSRLRAILGIWNEIWWHLRSAPYDLTATLYYDTRYKLLTLPIRARRKLLLSSRDRNTTLLPGRHHTDEYARLLLHLADPNLLDGETPTQLAPIPANLTPSLATHHSPLATQTTRIILAPAGARNLLRDDALRRWPIELYVQLAQLLLDRGHEVILIGGPDDAWASPAFAELPITDFMGKLTLLQTLALLNTANVTVTHDTGPLHLAGITSTAILTIFGPTDPHGRLPQRPNCLALWGGEGFACRPCYDGRDYAPCANNGCVQQVTPAFALTHIEALLAAQAANTPLPPQVLTPPHTPLVSLGANLASSANSAFAVLPERPE